MIKSFKNFIKEGSIRVNFIDGYGDQGYNFDYYDQPKKKKSKFQKKEIDKYNKSAEIKLDSTEVIKV